MAIKNLQHFTQQMFDVMQRHAALDSRDHILFADNQLTYLLRYPQLFDVAVRSLSPQSATVDVASFGCSYGHDCVSVALFLERELKKRNWDYRITGFDRVTKGLDAARSGIIPHQVQPPVLENWMSIPRDYAKKISVQQRLPFAKLLTETKTGYTLKPRLMQRLDFEEMDFTVQTPMQTYDFVIAANVAQYLTNEQQRLFAFKTIDCLRIGGLMIAPTSDEEGLDFQRALKSQLMPLGANGKPDPQSKLPLYKRTF